MERVASRGERILIFQLLIHIRKIFAYIQSLSENFRNLVSDIHPYPNATPAKYKTNRPWL